MRIVQINGSVFGSTGTIVSGISKEAEKNGDTVLIASPVVPSNRFREPDFPYRKIGTFRGRQMSVLLGRLTGREGCFSHLETFLLIKKLRKLHPDILHLHTLHGSYINLPMLFRYIKKENISTVWTFHDCWAFTGHCPHFESVGCSEWKTGCSNCPLYKEYPISYTDNSKKMYKLKKKWFLGVRDMTVVTPSLWLARRTEQSFLGKYPIRVINNGVDTSVFRPSETDFRKRYGLENKKIVLGVSFAWNDKKGLGVFAKLAGELPSEYVIVLVGTDGDTKKKLPSGILCIGRTEDQSELAEIYSAADVFVNPTSEDTYPTVNLEAAACGIPVITFNVGGCAETVDEKYGKVIERNDIPSLIREIISICGKDAISRADIAERAKRFDSSARDRAYMKLYGEIYDRTSENRA